MADGTGGRKSRAGTVTGGLSLVPPGLCAEECISGLEANYTTELSLQILLIIVTCWLVSLGPSSLFHHYLPVLVSAGGWHDTLQK